MLFRPRRKRSGSNKAKIGRQTLKKQNLALESEIYCIQIVNIIAPTINTETKVARMKILALTSYKSSKNTSHAVRACSRAGRGRSRVGWCCRSTFALWSDDLILDFPCWNQLQHAAFTAWKYRFSSFKYKQTLHRVKHIKNINFCAIFLDLWVETTKIGKVQEKEW